jgi:zinc-binding alcohol dehydrogenase family protein
MDPTAPPTGLMRAVAAPRALPCDDPRCLIDLRLPIPDPQPGDLLVRVEAVAVNPVDTKVRRSLPGDPAVPRVLGWDAAGVVAAVGERVERFRVGDAVFFAGDITRAGCNAELVAVDERIVGRRPSRLTAAEAAALPLTSLTAWEALFERARLDPDGADRGRSLLIIGAAGGVGSIAIQLARRAGLRVIATASRPASRAWVRELGADQVIDHLQPLPAQLQALGLPGVEVIANFADTDAYWNAMAEMILPQGTIVAIVGNRAPLDLDLLKAGSITFAWEFMFTRPRFRTPDMGRQGEILDRIASLVDAGQLRSTLRQTLSPIEAASLRQAHAQLESGTTVGKIALQGWGEPRG